MKISTLMSYAQGYVGATKEIVEMEKAGLDVAWVPEAYSFDGVSAMGYIAAKTEKITIASGILNIYSRTPALMAMTAAGIDALSEGRCMLGLGASGPQVIEGFHGVAYDAPMTRIREVVEICRMVWRREEKLVYFKAPGGPAGFRRRVPGRLLEAILKAFLQKGLAARKKR